MFRLWSDGDSAVVDKSHIPAPKVALPGHKESYNPPAEYLMTPEEVAEWKDTDPEDRKSDFIPKKSAAFFNYMQLTLRVGLTVCERCQATTASSKKDSPDALTCIYAREQEESG